MGACTSKDATITGSPPSGSTRPTGTTTTGARTTTATSAAAAAPRSTGAAGDQNRPRLASGASAGSTDQDRSDAGSVHSTGSSRSEGGSKKNPKTLFKSTSAIGLDEMIETRRENGDLGQNVVHIEVPFGKPIEEVYEGVHSGPVLGSGISGLVRLATHKATGVQYAVKCLDLGLVDTAEGLRQLREEIFIMCQLDHPNIVRLEEVYESHSEIYLVQELCLGGELFDRLDDQPDYHYSEAECARLVRNMLNAVRYLHSKGIIHRDLKLENFLFSSTAQDSELKMIDFGLSKHFRYGEQQHEAVGTPYTVAPEVIRGCYDERCDIWAIGVITFLLLSGDPPFGGCGGPEPLMTVRSNILRGLFAFEPEDIWRNVSQSARNFISSLLVTDPGLRPTAREAQKHEWLKNWANRARQEGDNVLNPNVVKALVSFKEFSDMRKLLCEVLSFTLLPDQIKDLRKEFEKLDTDGSGEISLSALKQVLVTNAGAGSLGALSEGEVEDIFNAMRVKKTETRIHWHEFIAAGLSQCQVDDRNLRLAFERLDIDHKGYITLDDIMELMGNDDLLSEEALEGMWSSSMEQAKCPSTHLTYDDFLLLMKGQSAEAAAAAASSIANSPGDHHLESSLSRLANARLLAVPEGESAFHDESGDIDDDDSNVILLPSGDKIHADGTILESGVPLTPVRRSLTGSEKMPTPLTPGGLNHSEGTGIDAPLSMDEDDFGTYNRDRDLTPPQTPTRGAEDYITPLTGRRSVDLNMRNIDSISVPGLPSSKPAIYVRRRSRSVDDKDQEGAEEEEKAPVFVANSRRSVLLPEHDHKQKDIDELVKDESKSALVVNRKLYRAHRQMRLAVLEASKRFEEQQAQHAKEVLLAQEDDDADKNKPFHAGLVMKHGHKKHVTTEAIKKMLRDNQVEQQALVETATRRGGRGKRNRKKTVSDMSGMLSSMGQDDLLGIAQAAAAPYDPKSEEFNKAANGSIGSMGGSAKKLQDLPSLLEEVPEEELMQMRDPTVPGDFRKTHDPFGMDGQYGATARHSIM